MVRRRAESEGGMSEKKDELVLGFYRDENGDVSFSGAEMLDAKGWLAVMINVVIKKCTIVHDSRFHLKSIS